MSGVYWGLTAMDLMGQLHRMNKAEVVEFVKSCQDPSGGFAPTEHHDPHLLYTLSAVQVGAEEGPGVTLTPPISVSASNVPHTSCGKTLPPHTHTRAYSFSL